MSVVPEPKSRSVLMTEPANPRTTVAVITARWASAFQKESGEKALREVLQAWREFYSEKHNGNDIKIDIADQQLHAMASGSRPEL